MPPFVFTHSPSGSTAFVVRDARAADTDAFMSVIALADPADADPFGLAREVPGLAADTASLP